MRIVILPSRTGGLAQLGERLPCTQEVSGSIPLSSTSYDFYRVVLYKLVFCDNQLNNDLIVDIAIHL